MKKAVIVIVILFGVVAGALFFYKDLIFSGFEKEIKNIPIEDNFELKKKQIKVTRDDIMSMSKLNDVEKIDVKNIKANNLLANRTSESIKRAILGYKNNYKNPKSSARQKAVALRKLSSIYWRTGGNKEATKDIFYGDFKIFLSEDGNVLRSNTKLLKKSYEIYPTSRVAIELAFNEVVREEYDEAQNWIDKYEDIKKDNERIFTLYREFLVYRVLAVNKKENKEYHVKATSLYNEILVKLKTESEKYNDSLKLLDVDEFDQTYPFLWMFYASYLADIDSEKNKDEINLLVEKIISKVKNDKLQEKNEFAYFLNIQRNKGQPDYICRNFVSSLAGASPKFRNFVLSYDVPESFLEAIKK